MQFLLGINALKKAKKWQNLAVFLLFLWLLINSLKD